MEKQVFKTTLNAPRETVWNILWNDETYRVWTAPFSEGSRAVTDWKKGSKALFLGTDNSGMVSTIAENIPNEFMSIKHLGIVKDGVEDTESKEVQQWAGALENYTLRSVGDNTELTIEMDTNEEFKDFFADTWPKALDKIKELSAQK